MEYVVLPPNVSGILLVSCRDVYNAHQSYEDTSRYNLPSFTMEINKLNYKIRAYSTY
jgi:hypothetical protein